MSSGHLELTKFLSWDSFYDTIVNGFTTLPSTFSKDVIAFYGQTDTLVFALISGLFFAFVSWILSLITGLHTWVDKWWSIVPVIVSIHFSIHDCLYSSSDSTAALNSRLSIVTVLISLWGARLTYNFNRKGGYSHGFVDYRWTYLETKVSGILFFIFNIVFICLYQNVLLVLLTVPLYVVQQAAHIEATPLNWIDAVATVGFIGCLMLEFVADNQQWQFYERRRLAMESKQNLTGDIKRGFLSHGVFRYSRHPNFFGEMGIWWFVYLYSVAATYPIHIQWFNPTIVGTIILTWLFQGSTQLTESLSSSKYPAYKQYQQTTSRLIPFFAGRSLDELDVKTN